MLDLETLLTRLLATTPPESCTDLTSAHAVWLQAWRETDDPFAAAVLTGFSGDRMAWAFAGGYQSALRAMLPQLADCEDFVTFCVSEAGGNRPRDIATRLEADGDGYRLNGRKQWATLSDCSRRYLVAARINEADAGRPQLKLVSVAADTVAREPMPPTPFTPEISHCKLHFDNLAVAADYVLEGDAYALYIKPFRLVEDTQVNAGLLGYLLRLARLHAWPRPVLLRLLSILGLLQQVAHMPVAAPSGHLLFAEAANQLQPLADPAAEHWQRVDADSAQRWARDLPLIGVAGKARALRLQRAWETLGQDK